MLTRKDIEAIHSLRTGGLPVHANTIGQLLLDYEASLAHIAALEADNAAMLDGVQRIRNLLIYPHDEWHQVAADAIREGYRLTKDDHPGAALLEEHRQALAAAERRHETTRATMHVREKEHRKALVRARNEAREAIAKMMESETGGHLMFWATRIRTLKEPEE